MAVNLKRERDPDRFFDRFVSETFETIDGFDAIFKPTAGGSSTSWQNREVIISLEVGYADGRSEVWDVSAGVIESITTTRNSGLATLKIASLNKQLAAVNAEKVKQGSQWYENQTVSYMINRLLETVFADSAGNLPDDKTIARELLTLPTLDDKIGTWTLESYPGWDGTTVSPSTASPIMSITTNSDRSVIYMGIGGTDGITVPELWSYTIDSDLWSKLGTTDSASGSTQKYAPIQHLFYNEYDNRLYGLLWQDKGDSKSDIENIVNQTNWICPRARMFWWEVDADSSATGYIDDNSHSYDLGNIWTGEWDFRSMFKANKASAPGPKISDGTRSTGSDTASLTAYKLDYRASVGNITSMKYVHVPFGAVGHQALNNHSETRRGVPHYHPQPASDYEDDPLMATWGNTLYGAPKGEMIPTTDDGSTVWSSASGTTPPAGFARAGSATFGVAGEVLTITNPTANNDGMDLSILSVEDNMTVYRLRVSGDRWAIYINPADGQQDSQNSIPYGPFGATNSNGYTATEYGNGDYYFSVLKTDAIPNWPGTQNLHMAIRRDPNSSGTVTLDNLSLTVARHWDKWGQLSRQAGENIPLTAYSKVAVGVSIRYPTHIVSGQPRSDAIGPQGGSQSYTETQGPGIEFYDEDVPGISTRKNITNIATETNTSNPGQRNEEILLELNMIGQDRRAFQNGGGGWSTGAHHPMYGPSEIEDGIPPDTVFRTAVGGRNIKPTAPTFSSSTYSNEALIIDIAPTNKATFASSYSGNTVSGAFTGESKFNYSIANIQSGRAGTGYGSVQLQAIGDRAMAATESDGLWMNGAVRYTNGQQGFFVFNQDLDEGKGAIVYCVFDGTVTNSNYYFDWGAGTSGAAGTGIFKIKYKIFVCENEQSYNVTGMTTATTVSPGAPHTHTEIARYPTAGCRGDSGYFYAGTIDSHVYTTLYNGSNETSVHAQSYIHKVNLGTGAINGNIAATEEVKYSSNSDASIYAPYMDGNTNPFGDYSASSYSAVNKTRKFQNFHYAPDLSEAKYRIMGSCFRRDSILIDPSTNGTPYPPCHEVFIMDNTDDNTDNKLIIIDHDMQSGTSVDAHGFVGFVNTFGNFGKTTTNLGSNNGVWYFRLKKATLSPSLDYQVGRGVQLNYFSLDDSGNIVAPSYWDDESTAALSKPVKSNEGFLVRGRAVNGIIDLSLDTEREGIFSAFDDWQQWTSTRTSSKKYFLSASSKLFFKLDDQEIDPRIRVYDFTGLTVFDAISKLSSAWNFLFGFDVSKFFIISRDITSSTHTLEASKGDIIDMTKTIDNDVRNVISISPFTPQLADVEWEVSHVGSSEVLSDERLFNGEFTMTVKTHKEGSVNMICTRQGRLIKDSYPGVDVTDAAASTTPVVVDSITNVEDRMIATFKWKTNNPSKAVVLTKRVGGNDTRLYLNTTFATSAGKLNPGEIVTFADPETIDQIGRVISSVDYTYNTVTLEQPLKSGSTTFLLPAGTPLKVVGAHLGSDVSDSTGDGVANASEIANYGTTFSDDGVCVIISTAVVSGRTVLTVNNMTPFRDYKMVLYSAESYKHYSFLVTTLGTSAYRSSALPSASGSSGIPLGWVHSVDLATQKITLANTNTAFTEGQVLRIHYAMAPAILIKRTQEASTHEPPPYTSVLQDLPEGLGTWSWSCGTEEDLWNVGDIINFKFGGMKLVKDGGSIYTGADTSSISIYGERNWDFPDNRFIPHEKVEYWVTKYLKEYGHPKLKITAKVPFDPTLTFTTPSGNALRKISIIDQIMFPGLKDFSVSGYLQAVNLNVKSLTMQIQLRTSEKY